MKLPEWRWEIPEKFKKGKFCFLDQYEHQICCIYTIRLYLVNENDMGDTIESKIKRD